MAKKKKKIERGYATISTAKKEQPLADSKEELIPENEELNNEQSVINDQSTTVPDNELSKIKDADRLLKWQVDYDYKLYEQKRLKLEANESVPYFQLPANEADALELLRNNEEGAKMVSWDEMNKTFLMMDKLGFHRNIIKACLKNSAGDLDSAIGWAYMNFPSADLPVWFSRENLKAIQPSENIIPPKETNNDEIIADFRMKESETVAVVKEVKEIAKDGLDKDLQQRILASLEWMDSDEEEETEEKPKAVEDYVSMYKRYLEFKNTVAAAKVNGDTQQKKSASNSAHKLMQKIIQIKSNMDLDQIKRADEVIEEWANKESPIKEVRPTKIVEVKDNDPDSLVGDELGLDIFEQSPIDENNSASKSIFIHDLSWKGWSGSLPSFWLSDFVRRKYPKGKISISLFPKMVAYRAKLCLKISDGETKDYFMDEDELVATKNDAKEYIALKTLFLLSPDAQIRNSVAPPFRELWEKWTDSAVRALKEESDALDEDRISFIENIILNESKISLRNVTFLDDNVSSRIRTTKVVSRVKGEKPRFDDAIFQKYLIDRSNLPIYSSRQKIIDQIRGNQVVIISGETGSGKSTQIPQYIMEDAVQRSDESFLQLYCCEPRRISAISLATRVSTECGDGSNKVGTIGSWIGYKVRMDNRTSKSTLVTFCTLGILLRMLVGDPNLSNISHVVVDEVHERSVESDFLLLLLKRLIIVRRDLKLILMSATADTQKYQAYFRHDFDPIYLHIPGKVFPVKEFYLDDIIEQIGWESEILETDNFGAKSSKKINVTGKGGKQLYINAEWPIDDELDVRESSNDMTDKMKDLEIRNRKIDMEFLESLIVYVVKNSLENSLGAILVFLPGVAEINILQERLEALSNGRSPLPCITFPLYSDLPNIEQLKVFDRVKDGFVKVVLSTNIAETGLTVPDVTFVIDTAKAREMSFDSTLNLTVLREIVVSKSNCLQRRGRAGRTQSGIYYNILPKSAFDSLPDHRPPELMRLPLEGICLKARAILGSKAGSLKSLFEECLDPPPSRNIEKAVTLLQQLQAMTKSEELTPLGIHLSKLGLDVRLGKMLLYAVVFRCLDPILTISACLSIGKSIFVTPFGDNTDYKRALRRFYAADSDLLMIYDAYLKWKYLKSQNPNKAAVNAYCRENYMNISVLSSLDSAKSQIIRSLLDTGILDRNQKICFGESFYDTNSSSYNITKTVLSVSFFPNIVQARKHPGRFGISLYRFGDNRPVNIHKNSFLCDNISADLWYGSNAMKASNRKIIALDLNQISPIGMLCLAANDIEINIIQHSLTVFDGSIMIKALPKALVLISKLSKLIQKAVDISLQSQSFKNGLTKQSANTIIEKFSNML